ncbi:ABC transporter ATP-binding protein [Priestia aryabhattai]|uniref:ABC transporter ATP-binding protein n=1 Tax=Priestia aryabhattai TaxID=412384 RepID=UPI002E20AAD9|nr:ABC transporter ATP-binding protein [Priestia aryabhattai]MED4261502.1 ABC transporter ATP-binding protein [Priestia aryabhattai]
MKSKNIGLKNLWRKTDPPKHLLFLGIILSLVNTACSLTIPLVLKFQVEEIVKGFSHTLLIKLIVLFAVELISMSFSLYFLAVVGQKVVLNLRERLWDKLLKLEVDFYNKNQSGEVVSRVTNDTTVTMNLLSTEIADLSSGILSIVGSVVILFLLDVPMTLVLLSSIPVILLIIFPISSKIQKISYEQQEEMSKFSGFLSKILSEIRLVKSHNAESIEYEYGKKHIRSLYNNGLKKAKIEAILIPVLSIIITFTIVLIVGYGAYRVKLGYISSGELLAFILYLFQIIGPVATIGRFITSLQSATGATERLFDILEQKEEREFQGRKSPSFGALSLKNISFKYADAPVLENISFRVKPNTMTAIVGASGVGKSTLFFLLERFYTPDDGEILLNGQSHLDIDIAKWRSMFSYVSQDSALIAGTIRENILYGTSGNVDEEEIIKACTLANCHEFIEAFPQGYETQVGERGTSLSGGQKQRIAIARALLRDTPFLLLDEATANLDSESENAIKEAIETLTNGRTTIVIAHRISTIQNANQIIVLDKGTISGTGTHQQLLIENALYQNLVYKQSAAS